MNKRCNLYIYIYITILLRPGKMLLSSYDFPRECIFGSTGDCKEITEYEIKQNKCFREDLQKQVFTDRRPSVDVVRTGAEGELYWWKDRRGKVQLNVASFYQNFTDWVGGICVCFTDLKTFLTDTVNTKIFQGFHIFAFGSQMKNFHCIS